MSLVQRILGHIESRDAQEEPEQESAVTQQQMVSFVREWLTSHNRSDEPRADVGYNEMQICGIGLCGLLHQTSFSGLDDYDAKRELLQLHGKLFVGDFQLRTATWAELQTVIHSVQQEFRALFTETPDGAVKCAVNLWNLVLCVMERMGFFLSHKFRCENATVQLQTVDPLVDVDKAGWRRMRKDAVRQLLLGIHIVLGAHDLLVHAIPVPCSDQDGSDERCHVQEFHKEASLDTFYSIDMIMTVRLGSIVEYQDQFRHLFHSVSQVVYYHFPKFDRRRQKTLPELQQPGVQAQCLLPLLMELDPTIPVLYEQTGAGHSATHAALKFAWTVLGPLVVLVDQNRQSYIARDLRTLLRFKWEACGEACGESRGAEGVGG